MLLLLLLMEHSQNSSSMGRKSASACVNEESGWTSYFEDFSKGMEQSYCSSLGGGGSFLVSDAASCAAWNHHNIVSCSSVRNLSNLPKKLCFKKTRTKQISEDDPLEDTASSPLNSPKVGDLNPKETISRKIDDQLDGSLSKGFKSEHYSDLRTDEHENEINFHGKKANNIDCTDLKKRGLCLVPLSMLVNYYG